MIYHAQTQVAPVLHNRRVTPTPFGDLYFFSFLKKLFNTPIKINYKSNHIVEKTIKSYLLGLLAKIKCSICSYQCENWYLSYGRAFSRQFLYMGTVVAEISFTRVSYFSCPCCLDFTVECGYPHPNYKGLCLNY